jgi:hypothetical protein
MSDRTTLLDLAHRCEQAAGPDKELDFTIDNFMLKHGPEADRIRNPRYVLSYTASLDAAVTLVPEGWRLGVLSEWDNETLRKKGPWQCIVMPAGKGDSMGIGLNTRCDHAATAALALCAAALRARAVAHDRSARY